MSRIVPSITRFARYAAGSALATVVSAVVFALVYRAAHGEPRLASLSAFAAGAAVNFAVGRFWAWRRRGPGLGRQAAGYAVVAVTTALAAVGVTSVTGWYAGRAGLTDVHRAVVVELAYFATYAVAFGVKFVLLDRVVFAAARATRS